jgi:hypothetical protein
MWCIFAKCEHALDNRAQLWKDYFKFEINFKMIKKTQISISPTFHV